MNKNILFNALFALLTFFTVILFYENILLTTIILIIIAILGLVRWKSLRTLKIFFLAGIFGTIAEIIAIKMGIWNYEITNFLDIPAWLFIVWGNAGAFIYQTAKEIKESNLNIN